MPALRSVNKVILVGNLTKDPEMNFTAASTPVCVFTVATNRAWKNANEERHEEASFHRINAWGKFGENLSKLLKKGMKVYVEGILTYREKRDDAGKLVSKDARIRAESVIVLERAGRAVSNEEMEAAQGEAVSSSSHSDDFDLDAIANDLESHKTPSAAPAAAEKSAPSSAASLSDDDLPF